MDAIYNLEDAETLFGEHVPHDPLDNRAGAINDVIDNDPVANAIRGLMEAERAAGRAVWAGNAQTLLGALKLITDEAVTKSKTWPDTPRALSGRFTRASTFLRASGIEIVHQKSGDRKFFISYSDKADLRPYCRHRQSQQKTGSGSV